MSASLDELGAFIIVDAERQARLVNYEKALLQP